MMFVDWTTGFIPGLIKAGQLLSLISLGLYLGQQGLRGGAWRGWAILTAFMALGFALSFASALYDAPGTMLFIATALAGAAGALSWPRLPAGYVLAAISGAALGASANPVGGQWPDSIPLAAANFIGINLLAIFMTGLAARVQAGPFWMGIGIRIIAAWTLAISIIMLSLAVTQ